MGIGKSQSVRKTVERLYAELGEMALFDDRHESPGVKFNDCELIGVPLRVVISTRLLEHGKAEVYERRSRETREIVVDEVTVFVGRFMEQEGIDRIETQA